MTALISGVVEGELHRLVFPE